MKKKLYYFCFYGDEEISDKITTYPSVWSKIDYICKCLTKTYDVEIVALGRSKKGKFKGETRVNNSGIIIKYFSSKHSKNRLLNRFYSILFWKKIAKFIKLKAKQGGKILIYHSIDNYYWLKSISKSNIKFCLEVEEVFSELFPSFNKQKKKEWSIFNMASSFLCINDYVCEKLPQKKKIISYGVYEPFPKYECTKNNSNTCKVVYAGIIEEERQAAFLAVKAAAYLPKTYEVHIIGFGKEDVVEKIKKMIAENNKKNTARIYFHEAMYGKNYYKFLQSCDIGLSTHVYLPNNMSSADNTFPSKIFVYLGNGLNVVAQRIRCLEESSISNLISFYNNPTPAEVALAIKKTKVCRDVGISQMKKMHNNFADTIWQLFDF